MGSEGSVYFGRTKFMNTETSELCDSIEHIEEEEEKAKYTKVRHECGVQLYGKTASGVTCKYAGEWVKDTKTGDAHCIYPDGSEYKGNFLDGVFNGQGHFWWPTAKTQGNSNERHCYLGMWVDGKMQGKGEFVHADGHTLKGYFANNFFSHTYDGKKYFLNPLDSKTEHQRYIKNCLSSIVYDKKQLEKHKETITVFKANSLNQLQDALNTTK